MKHQQTPDPEFVGRLEWELQSALRRSTRLGGGADVRPSFQTRWGTALALIVVSLFLGGAGTYAAMHGVDEEVAALNVARAETLLEIARTRLEPAVRDLARMQGLAEQSAVNRHEVQQVEAAVVHAETEVAVRRLELDETRQTGLPSDNSLSAALVGGRDFVAERLTAQRRPLRQQVQLATEQLRHQERLRDTGLAPVDEAADAARLVADVIAQLEALNARIALRAAFIAGEISAAEAELEGMRVAAATAREAAVRELHYVTDRQKRMADLIERGLAPMAELSDAEAKRRTASARVELADLELRIVEQKLDRIRDQLKSD